MIKCDFKERSIWWQYRIRAALELIQQVEQEYFVSEEHNSVNILEKNQIDALLICFLDLIEKQWQKCVLVRPNDDRAVDRAGHY